MTADRGDKELTFNYYAPFTACVNEIIKYCDVSV